MKTMTFFELGYLDLFKMIFLGKKIRLVPDRRVRAPLVTRTNAVKARPSVEEDFAREDRSSDTNWHPGNLFNPYTGNPFDTLNR